MPSPANCVSYAMQGVAARYEEPLARDELRYPGGTCVRFATIWVAVVSMPIAHGLVQLTSVSQLPTERGPLTARRHGLLAKPTTVCIHRAYWAGLSSDGQAGDERIANKASRTFSQL